MKRKRDAWAAGKRGAGPRGKQGRFGRLLFAAILMTLCAAAALAAGSPENAAPGPGSLQAADTPAQPRQAEFTVHFDSQGGSMIADAAYPAGMPLPEPAAPVRPGFLFQGWYRDPYFVTLWDFEHDMPESDMTLFALWAPEPVTGLPSQYTMYLGETAVWTPYPPGGGWVYDPAFFAASPASPPGFTAIMEGHTEITYKLNGAVFTISVTILSEPPPATGERGPDWIAIAALAIACGFIVILFSQKARKPWA